MKSAGLSYPLILIGAFGLVLVLVIGGVVLLQNNENTVQPAEQEVNEDQTTQEIPAPTNTCENVVDLQEQITCYSDMAVEQNDHSICLQLQDQQLHDGCLLVFGVKTNKLYPCALMKSTKTIEKEVCVSVLIQKATDIEEACNSLNDTAPIIDMCLIAKSATGQQQDCPALENELFRNRCYLDRAQTTGSIAWCDPISISFSKDNCYLKLAEQLNDYSVCSNIESQYVKYGFCAPK